MQTVAGSRQVPGIESIIADYQTSPNPISKWKKYFMNASDPKVLFGMGVSTTLRNVHWTLAWCSSWLESITWSTQSPLKSNANVEIRMSRKARTLFKEIPKSFLTFLPISAPGIGFVWANYWSSRLSSYRIFWAIVVTINASNQKSNRGWESLTL